MTQPPIGPTRNRPHSVTVPAVAVEISSVGTSCGMRLVTRSRMAAKHDRQEGQQGIGVETLEAGPHDDGDADEAGENGQPAAPADAFAEQQRRAHGDGERQCLQHGRDIGDRQLGKRYQEGDRCERLAGHAQHDQRLKHKARRAAARPGARRARR